MFRLAMVPGKGRGLLASQVIDAGACIERVPAVRLSAADRASIDRTALFPYTFVEPETFGQGRHGCLLAFGSLTFCNHSESPNAAVYWREADGGLWAELEALREIAPDEEITLSYTNISEYSAGNQFI